MSVPTVAAGTHKADLVPCSISAAIERKRHHQTHRFHHLRQTSDAVLFINSPHLGFLLDLVSFYCHNEHCRFAILTIIFMHLARVTQR